MVKKTKHKNKIFFLCLTIFLVITSSYASAATRYWIGDNTDLAIDPDNVLFVNTTNNKIGSGTTSPDQKLQVVGDVMIGETDATGGTLYLYGTTAGKYSRLLTSNGNLHIDSGYGAGGSNGLYLNYYDGGTIYFGNGASSYHSYSTTIGSWNLDATLYVDGSGKVGIGDASPDNVLDVEGTGTVASFYSSNAIALQSTGTSYGIVAQGGAGGRGIYGHTTAGSGTTYGVYGYSASSSGYSGWFTGGNGVYSDGYEVYNRGNCRHSGGAENSRSCTGNEEVTGGGCYCSCGSNRMRYSRPNTALNRWECSCADCTATTYVICCGA